MVLSMLYTTPVSYHYSIMLKMVDCHCHVSIVRYWCVMYNSCVFYCLELVSCNHDTLKI